MTLTQLVAALQSSWGAKAAYEAENWSPQNPARGLCAVSSLVVQDYLGGDIIRLAVRFDGVEEKHFVNLIDGAMVDTTFSQFPESGVELRLSPADLSKYGSVRERLLSDEDTARRYRYLQDRVARRLQDGTSQ